MLSIQVIKLDLAIRILFLSWDLDRKSRSYIFTPRFMLVLKRVSTFTRISLSLKTLKSQVYRDVDELS